MSRANPATTHQYAGIAAWNVKLRAEIHSYDDARKFLGDQKSEKLGAHMFVLTTDDYATIDIVLYSTTILRYTADGKFWADNGGYNTPTTTQRLNMLAPGPLGAWRFAHSKKRLVGWSPRSCAYNQPMGVGKLYPVSE